MTPKRADLLGSILSSMEKPPSLGDQESSKLQEQEKQQKVSDFIQDSGQIKKKFQPMNKIGASYTMSVAYIMIFKKEFVPSDEELDSYRWGKEWDPQKRQEEEAAQQGGVVVSPASDYKDQVHHLIRKGTAKDAAHMDARSIEEAMNEIPAKKHLRQSGKELSLMS
ncbi:unnamed protein product [Nyctereutes procyonoides]|uniref:(raccoon dog) hypothetical protein n=1 Tax=Nyctereutes procyonoides TaxID=34880 RepID=A0A811Y7I7_NYCPR|nr:unnamed protein product [Nyctereutes procyonoides]